MCACVVFVCTRVCMCICNTEQCVNTFRVTAVVVLCLRLCCWSALQLSSVQQILATQLGGGMMYPVNRFLQADLDGNFPPDVTVVRS